MTANDKRSKSVNCVEEDRIGNLPEHLIESILDRLPIQEAVRTSILSKKWRYRWTRMQALVFDKHFSNKYAKNGAFGHNGFIRIINHVLFLHNGPVLKFRLQLPNISLDGFHDVDLWMLYLSRNGVNEFVLTNSNRRYELSSYMFSCLQLTKLELELCFFEPPLKFKGFPNLEDLKLCYINFGANLCGTQINLPQLKVLSLCWCTNVCNFNIKATKLQRLAVQSCPDAMLLHLLDSPCLVKLVICYQKPEKDILQMKRMNLGTMLSKLPRIEHLIIDRDFFKYVIKENSLKFLDVCIELGELCQLHGVLCLLRNSPNVETLWIGTRMTIYGLPQVDEGPALNYLETPNCLDCTLNQLQAVEIWFLEGSRPELLFIKLLLAHSPSLKKLTISPIGALDDKEIREIAKNVMRFPQASPKAEIIYLT